MSLEDKVPKPSEKELNRRRIDKIGNDKDPENNYIQLNEALAFEYGQ